MRIEHSSTFEVIVVGGGLAGLSAAYELSLRQKSVLLLEAGERLGGKVETCRRSGVVYERGALFAFGERSAGLLVETGRRIEENHPIGVFLDGHVVSGETVPSCLAKLRPGVRELLLLRSVIESDTPQPDVLGERLHATLEAFFQVIHPGELGAYVPARRGDSLVRHDTAHFENGNESLVKALVQQTDAEIRTGCRVDRLVPQHRGVSVFWRREGKEEGAGAEWAVLAVPAPEARRLTTWPDRATSAFLGKVRYGAGIAVILGLREARLRRFSYIVSPEGPVTSFVFSHEANVPDVTIVTAYLVAEKARRLWEADDANLGELVFSKLQSLNIGRVAPEDVVFRDVVRWPEVGPVISEETYGLFTKSCLRPSERIVLAGDYTWWNERQMPYGMEAAVLSGRRASKLVADGDAVCGSTRFRPEYLAVSSLAVLTDGGPEFKTHVEDGTVAYYGLLLKAKPDEELERYLLAEAEDALWSYQQDYGVTSLDSALVMEGLLSTGRHDSLLQRSADRLVDAFFDDGEGGFRTLPHGREGRAPYWGGTDCVATAYCAWLLHQIAPRRHETIVRACVEHLKRKQLVSGRWPGKWFPSETIPVFYALRLLTALGSDCEDSCRRACVWLCSRQHRDGSWMSSVIETAAAILALRACAGPGDPIQRGRDWISAARVEGGWPGEPILQYWFDDQGQRIFFHTRDRGRITTAWATIALRESEGPRIR